MRKVHAGLAITAVLCLGLASAQEGPAPRPAPRPAPGGEIQPLRPLPGGVVQTASTADQQLAACIFTSCRNELEVAKFAQAKIQSEEVRAFAEKMIRDHTPDCEAYQRFAGNLVPAHHAADDREPAAAAPGAALRPAGEPPAAAAPPAGVPRVDVDVARPGVEVNIGGRAGGAIDWVAIHRELGDQCLATTKKELGRHEGAEFDHCFMGQQFAAHMMVLDQLKVLRKHASPQLAAQIDKSTQVVQAHLEEARQINERLKGTPSERVSRRPEGK